MSNNEEAKEKAELTQDETGPVESGHALDKTQFFADPPSSKGTAKSGSGSASPANGLPPTATSGVIQSVGGYRLIRKLGEGGMGRVYQAADDSGRMVAIKLLSPELARSPEALDRFRQEGIIASAISHPHCVFVHRADEDNGTPFIAMELMTGQTLKDLVAARGPLPAGEAVRLILQCIDGLIEAHSKGMVHRDVKPANCYLDAQGSVKIGDFGLARSLLSDSELTQTGAFLGTPLYASPEQILGDAVDEQSDIYSLSATLYFLLAGRAPFESPNAPQVIAKIVSADPPRFSEVGIAVSKKLEQVVLRGLARDRTKRFDTFHAFRDELAQTQFQRDRVATLPRRVLASVIDGFLLSMVVAVVVLIAYALHARTSDSVKYYINILGTLWLALYLLISEAIFGTTIGKHLLNLRVVDPELGNRPRFTACAIRTTVFIVLMNFIEFVGSGVLLSMGLTISASPILYAVVSWIGFFVGCIAQLVVWNSSKKTQLLHEKLSKTETWLTQPKAVTGTVELTPLLWKLPIGPGGLWSQTKKLGRFDLIGPLETEDDSTWLAAHDDTIGRDVWIQICPANAPPPTESREKCVRRTRLRFLETGGDQEFRWNAYVAPEGAPISQWFDHRNPMPWTVTRQVLQDVINELASNESLPISDSSRLSRWWLSPAGKLILVEPLIKVDNASSGGKTPGSLFSEIASLALPDTKKMASERSDSQIAAMAPSDVAPYRATQLLQEMKSARVSLPQDIQKRLEMISQSPQVVTLTMRVVHAAILSLALIVPWAILAFALLIPDIFAVVESQKGAQMITTFAAVMRDSDNHKELIQRFNDYGIETSKYESSDRITELERYAEVLHLKSTRSFDSLGFLERTIIEQQNRLLGRDAFFDKPTVQFTLFRNEDKKSDDEPEAPPGLSAKLGLPKNQSYVAIREKGRNLESLKERLEKYELSKEATVANGVWSRLDVKITLLIWGLLALWVGVCRGGLTPYIAGLAVVRRDGRRASIVQCVWRTFLFWLPIAIVVLALQLLESDGLNGVWWTQQLRRLYLILPFIYLVAVVRWPQRGLHDWASGTYVVPR